MASAGSWETCQLIDHLTLLFGSSFSRYFLKAYIIGHLVATEFADAETHHKPASRPCVLKSVVFESVLWYFRQGKTAKSRRRRCQQFKQQIQFKALPFSQRQFWWWNYLRGHLNQFCQLRRPPHQPVSTVWVQIQRRIGSPTIHSLLSGLRVQPVR